MRLKCLSLYQPWATLVALGAKSIETRSWSTEYRGPLAIHAARRVSALALCHRQPFRSVLAAHGYICEVPVRAVLSLPLGSIVAVCELVDVVKVSKHPLFLATAIRTHLGKDHSDQDFERELTFGDYSPGRYMWLLSNVRALPQPIPARARPGLFEVDIPGEEMERRGG